tara:strand:- start:393 stop:734 length:342 start_codon:yes stop_codon:yes gene_type:complete
MSNIKTKNYKQYSNAIRKAQAVKEFDYKDSYPGIGPKRKEGGGFSLLRPIIKTIDKITGFKRTKDTDGMDINKAKKSLEKIKYGKEIPKTVKIGNKRVKNLKHGQSFLKTLLD